jgi:ABC-2 type transport system ATP-binding protein/lipopolysaccharide transport system ATP-binding protein
VVDEVLSVGDAVFQQKSRQRIVEMIAAGTGVILVSHDMDLIGEVADRVMLLMEGHNKGVGPPEEMIQAYRDEQP